ncbi:MAG: PGF-CTERM sorting domain-containing protein [Halobacteriales archaeon SW_9_67_24]|nr:MAG: PGF-CTERM sorting domain-containing protein [Halobacteriales archaeon SW_9_67_24]
MRSRLLSILLVAMVATAAVGPATAATGTQTAAATDTPTAAAAGPAADLAAQANCSFPTTATDATGTEVTVEGEPEEVVALGASTAQTLWEIGAREKVTGMPVDSTTASLAGSENRTGIYQADGFTVATEQVIGLDADLVLAANVIPNETVTALREAGLTVFKFDPANSLSGVYEKTELMGQFVGACAEADRVVDAMQTRVETVRTAVGNETQPSALYLLSGGFVAGNGTFIGDLLRTAGAENLAANANISSYQEISEEVIAERDPEWIVVSNRSFVPEGEPWASTTAVEEEQVVVVSANNISQAAPRVVLPLTDLARAFHPDAMAAATLTNTTIGTATGNATPIEPTTAATTATETGTDETGTTTATTTAAVATTVEPTTSESPDATTTEAVPETMTNESSDEATAETTETSGANADTATSAATGTTTSSGSGPGFGAVIAVVAVLAGTLLAAGRDGL